MIRRLTQITTDHVNEQRESAGVTRLDLPWASPILTKNTVRRMHYQTEAKARKVIVDAVTWLARGKVAPMVGANVTLHWRMADKRRRDGDGAAPTLAACIDGLVRAGVLPDDSWVHVPSSGVTCHPPLAGKPGAMWLEIESLGAMPEDTEIEIEGKR